MQGVTFEQFKSTLDAMSTKDIRRMIKDGYGIELPVGHSKSELIELAWQKLGNELPAAVADTEPPAEAPAEAISPATAAAGEADPAAAPADEASPAARPPTEPPPAEAPKPKRYEARCHGIESRYRAGQYWTRDWLPASESQLEALRADPRMRIREF